jgi:hypothetical protein
MAEDKVIDLNKVLPAATSEKYKISNLEGRNSTRLFFAKFGTIDFTKLSVAKAALLVEQKAPFISEKKKNEAPAAPGK